MLDEKQRLDDLEQELLTREGKLDPGSKNHRKKSLSSKPKKWPRGRVGRSTNDILDNKENMSLIDNQ